ncbi:membrane-bound lytic murein transglycosylase MltF [Halomonas sp.]|uniref:membrane-bound lytic murein transglycosylase MltF n=1 Tax=Halomonas sp. TaxID=1486246 RepID=UPI0025BB019D|nr:membrane-bound lytic murein transglycosylase MltF [Halomonas sp.]
MPIRHAKTPLASLLPTLGLAGLMLAGCGQESPRLASPEESGILKVATRNAATTWYLDRDEAPAGPEHDLVSRFAESRGWQVEWAVHDAVAEVLQALEAGEVHMAAAGLTHLPSRNERFLPGPAHTAIVEQLVCHREARPLPRSVEQMAEVEIRVTADSSYADKLASLVNDHSGITFQEDPRTTEMLLTAVAGQELDCTLADSNIVRVVRRHYPSLEVALNLTSGDWLGWYLAADQSALAEQTHDWRSTVEAEAAIEAVENRYYGYIDEFDFVDLRALNQRIDERLPDFLELFLMAEHSTGIPADLLAALSYQESHWNPQAVSPTGVRGIMMLTLNTAQSLGVSDRLDPTQAIDAGARYLADRHQRLPEEIPEPDRTYLALASYNIGRGHVLDARELARELGKNPDSWEDMQEILPLKADKRYYPRTRYGYARGYEPVHFVQRIRNYRDVISASID